MADPNARTTDLETALRTTAAIREFTDRPVTREDLADILDVARFAPSGSNQQAWHVVSVEDPTIRARIDELIVVSAKEYLALAQSGARPFGLSEGGRWPGPGAVDLDAARDGPLTVPVFATLADAPALLAVLVHLPRLSAMDVELDRHGLVAGASIYPFCRDLLLAARLRGLGGVLTTFAVRREPEALAALDVPEDWALAAVIALGEPVHQPTRLRRNPVADFATVDTFTGAGLTAAS